MLACFPCFRSACGAGSNKSTKWGQLRANVDPLEDVPENVKDYRTSTLLPCLPLYPAHCASAATGNARPPLATLSHWLCQQRTRGLW